MTEDDFYKDFMQDIYARSGAEENYCEAMFTEVMCESLDAQQVVNGYELEPFKRTSRPELRVDAWSLNKQTETLCLFVSDYSTTSEIKTLNRAGVDKYFKRVERFFLKSGNPSFYREMEESLPGYGIAREIAENIDAISKVRFFLLSNSKLSDLFKMTPRKGVEGYECSYDIWDIGLLYKIWESGKAKEDIIIDFTEFVDGGIASLPAFTGSDVCQSYLLVMPGEMLSSIYDKYGERLLEQNVRTFLQFRGGVNKNIRNTIQNEPDMFFAYNNGLTVTAEAIDFDGNSMLSATNLQIVNGGQTTASLFMTKRLDKEKKVDLSKVHVQVKLSVIAPDRVDDVVPAISKSANTQNKVSAADFFSNHPFHRSIENFSRRILAPSAEGLLVETYWYYERARGQYANKQSKMTKAQQKKFLIQNPKKQMFTKTDLAKFENSFAMKPHFVSKGAQWNFGKFAEDIGGKDNNRGKWELNDAQFNELYFKRLIAKAILFKFLDGNIMRQSWYSGYKANIVTYSLSKIAQLASDQSKYIDFMSIWRKQSLSPAMECQLLELAEQVNDQITDTELNVTQYCKQLVCWQKIEKLDIALNDDVRSELVDAEEVFEREKEAKRGQKMLKGIEAQTYVLDKGSAHWISIIEWGDSSKALTEAEVSFLMSARKMPARLPSDKQCERIVKVEQRAIEEGFFAK